MSDITQTALTDVSGLIPGYTFQTAPASNALQASVSIIPNTGLKYKGQLGGYVQPSANGTSNTVADGGDTVALAAKNWGTPSEGNAVELVRAINETVVHWNDTALTGNNAVKYFDSKVGNFSISDQTAVKRTYSTDLYYKIGETLASRGSNIAS